MRNEEWLHKAKSLAIGMRTRAVHGREDRPNLVIGNDPDKWWCYCHSCKKGGVVKKDHVILGAALPPKNSTELSVPTDLVGVEDYAVAHLLMEFLASKHMDFRFFPNEHCVKYSASRQRMILTLGSSSFGRDLTGRSHVKWLNYNGVPFVTGPSLSTDQAVIVVEDLLSYLKVSWAMSKLGYTTVCALGTNISDKLVAYLVAQSRPVVWMMDGDEAGWKAAATGVRRLTVMGVPTWGKCAPAGMDPKDLTVTMIRDHLEG